MNDQWRIGLVVCSCVTQVKTATLCKINLVGSQCKLTTDHTPYLHVDLWTIKRRFILNLHVRDIWFLQHVSYHFLGLDPKLWFIYIFNAKLLFRVQWKPHHIFIDTKYLKVFKVHIIHSSELVIELFLGTVNMCIIHMQATNSHQTK